MDDLSVNRSLDSLSVHKARLGKIRRPDEQTVEPSSDSEPGSPSCDLEVQSRIDSIALAQKRMGKKSSGSEGSGSPPSKAKGGPRTRFAGDNSSPTESGKSRLGGTSCLVGDVLSGTQIFVKAIVDDYVACAAGAITHVGRKLAETFSLKKKEKPQEEEEPAIVDINATSTHVRFSEEAEVVQP